MRTPVQVFRDYRARRRAAKAAMTLLVLSAVVRPSDGYLRYPMSDREIEQLVWDDRGGNDGTSTRTCGN
jgi:hypothetical protein